MTARSVWASDGVYDVWRNGRGCDVASEGRAMCLRMTVECNFTYFMFALCDCALAAGRGDCALLLP